MERCQKLRGTTDSGKKFLDVPLPQNRCQVFWGIDPSRHQRSARMQAPVFRILMSFLWFGSRQIKKKYDVITTSWWLNHPSEKYESNWIISPSRGENKRYLSCHHLVMLMGP